MKNLTDLNESTGMTLYAYSVNGKIVTSFMKLADLEKTVKPEGATIVKSTVPGVHF
jgi:hypothetical protein